MTRSVRRSRERTRDDTRDWRRRLRCIGSRRGSRDSAALVSGTALRRDCSRAPARTCRCDGSAAALLLRSRLRVFLRPLEDALRLPQAREHRRRDRLGLGVIVDVDVEPVHHVEVRIAEELLQRGAAHVLVDFRMKKPRKSESSVSSSTGGSSGGGALRIRRCAGAAGGCSASASRASAFSRDQRPRNPSSSAPALLPCGASALIARRRQPCEADSLVLVARVALFLLRLGLVVRFDELADPRQ